MEERPGWGKRGERTRGRGETETDINQLPLIHGSQPRYVPGSAESNPQPFLVYRTMLQPTEPPGQGFTYFLKECSRIITKVTKYVLAECKNWHCYLYAFERP